jgi:endonuclease
MKSAYQHWLEHQGYAVKSVQTRMAHAGRVEERYGDLDQHYDRDQLGSVIDELMYSTEDERRNKPNPSKIPFNGNARENLASYKSATELYCKFRRETAEDDNTAGISMFSATDGDEAVIEHGQLKGLERDLQAALRRAIDQLEPGLEIVDDGAGRSVSSGFIDITARDARGSIVVIELKTGTARQNAVAQVLSYMGCVAAEEPDAEVRGILVAADFDKKTRAAARMVPALSLRAYRVSFEFTNADEASV